MDYSKKTRDELIAICKERHIKGYSGKKRDDILRLLSDLPQLAPAPTNVIVDPDPIRVDIPTETKGVIYALWINERPYVGQSRVLDKDGNPTRRWNRHDADATNPTLYVHRAIALHGIQRRVILETITCEAELLQEQLNVAEIRWVTELNSMMPEKGGIGYNHAPAGGAFPHEPHTEEYKAYMSARMSGRVLSDKTKEKLRLARTGVPIKEVTKEKHRLNAKIKYDTQIFPEGLVHFLKWREDNSGKFPRCSNEEMDDDEHKASSWYWCVIRKYNDEELSTDQLTELNALEREGKWRWKRPDEFLIQVDHYKSQYTKWGGVIRRNTKTSRDDDRHKAMLWLTRMRQLYRNNDTRYLTPERRSILEGLRDEGILTL